MKLSDAILLGDNLKRPRSDTWISSGGTCGCALGGALLAAGVTVSQFHMQWYGTSHRFEELACVKALWPWLTRSHITEISSQYHAVCDGNITLEQLCDYVRSIEPAEPEPENYEDAEEYWSDADTTREMVNSIKGR